MREVWNKYILEKYVLEPLLLLSWPIQVWEFCFKNITSSINLRTSPVRQRGRWFCRGARTRWRDNGNFLCGGRRSSITPKSGAMKGLVQAHEDVNELVWRVSQPNMKIQFQIAGDHYTDGVRGAVCLLRSKILGNVFPRRLVFCEYTLYANLLNVRNPNRNESTLPIAHVSQDFNKCQ